MDNRRSFSGIPENDIGWWPTDVVCLGPPNMPTYFCFLNALKVVIISIIYTLSLMLHVKVSSKSPKIYKFFFFQKSGVTCSKIYNIFCMISSVFTFPCVVVPTTTKPDELNYRPWLFPGFLSFPSVYTGFVHWINYTFYEMICSHLIYSCDLE